MSKPLSDKEIEEASRRLFRPPTSRDEIEVSDEELLEARRRLFGEGHRRRSDRYHGPSRPYRKVTERDIAEAGRKMEAAEASVLRRKRR